MHRTRHSRTGALAAALVIAGLAAAAAADTTVRSFTGRSTHGSKRMRVELGVGKVQIVPSRDSEVHAHLDVRCKGRVSRCEEQAESVELKMTHLGDQLDVTVTGFPKLNSKLYADLMLEVPARTRLELEMGVGKLEIAGVEGDVKVDLGVGEVELRMPSEAVGTVHGEASVGDANLMLGRRRVRGEGWLGKEVDWGEGAGRSVVHVSVGVGDVSIELD